MPFRRITQGYFYYQVLLTTNFSANTINTYFVFLIGPSTITI